MANRTDTKAIEQANNKSLLNSTSDNTNPKDAERMLLDACNVISTIVGADDFTLRSVATQLCKITDYMLPYKQQDVMDAENEVISAEDAVDKDVAGANGRLERARDKLQQKKEVCDDVTAFHKANRENFFLQTGDKYVPAPPKTAKSRRPSREERLAKLRA